MPEEGISATKGLLTSSVLGILSTSGVIKGVEEFVTTAGKTIVGSAYGEKAGNVAGEALSSAISGGIAAGVLTMNPLLIAVGAMMGGIMGAMNGAFKNAQKDDDGYKGWYNGLYKQSRVDSAQSLLSGSALAGVLGKVKTAARRGGGEKDECFYPVK